MKHINHTFNYDIIKELGFAEGVVLNALKAWSDAEFDSDKTAIDGKEYFPFEFNYFCRSLSFILDWNDTWSAVNSLIANGYIEEPVNEYGETDCDHLRVTEKGNLIFSHDRTYEDK